MPTPARLAFGQPLRAICQIAYVVPDLAAAVQHYVDCLHMGPWFLAEHFTPRTQHYHGESTGVDVSIATAYSGSMMVELIQQNDDSPSVFRDTVDATGYGFHHWAVTTRDFTADAAEYRALGYSAAFEVVMPELFDGGRITYFDARADVPGMIELIELNDHVERFFASIKRAADSWDGTTTTVSLSGSA